VDRIVQVVFGILLLVWARVGWRSIGGWVVGIIGVFLLVTGLVGYCALYSVFGIRTCKVSQE